MPLLRAAPDAAKPADPAKTPDAPKADAKSTVSPDAQALVDEVSSAYAKLKTLELAGTFSGEFDAGGQKQGGTIPFTSSFESPNKFRHNAKDDVTIGSTGEKAYLYVKQENGYIQETAPKDKVATKDLPDPLPRVITMQNPSLMLALAKDPAHEITDNTTDVSKAADEKLGDSNYPALKLTLKDGSVVTLLIDSTTHLIRQSTADVRGMLEKRGVPDVKKAFYKVEYTTSTPDAATKADQFAWCRRRVPRT